MPQLQPGRSPASYGQIVLFSDAEDDADPTTRYLPLHLDGARFKDGKPQVHATYAPTEPVDPLAVQAWAWQNGSAGAGTSVETPSSQAGGGSERGEPAWLRRLGVAQAPGRVRELTLPTGTRGLTSGQFTQGVVYRGTLYLTTLTRYVVTIEGAGRAQPPGEHDLGGSAQTVGAAIFNGNLYVGTTGTGIAKFDGTSWTAGNAGTERGLLATLDWRIGDALATGGASGAAGTYAWRLIGVNPTGTGFQHVAGDPTVAANWSAPTTVGTGGSAFPVLSLATSNRVVWFGTGTGVHGVDQLGDSPNLTKWVEQVASLANCSAICFWNGLVWMNVETGLAAFAPDGSRIDVPTMPQFGGRSGTTPVYGRPLFLAPSPDGLYAGYHNYTTSTSYVGCLVLDPGGGYRWSMPEAVFPGEIVTYIQQVMDTRADPGLFIGTVGATDGRFHLYRQDLPRSGDPETEFLHNPDGPFAPMADWGIRLSRFDGGHAVKKAVQLFEVEADRIGPDYPDNTLQVQVSNDGGDYVTEGTATTSPYWSGRPSAGRSLATSVQVRVVVHQDPAAPVVLRSVGVKYGLRPRRKQYLTYPIIIGAGHVGQDPAIVWQRVQQALVGGELTWTDHLGLTAVGLVEAIANDTATLESGRWVIRADLTLSRIVQSRFDVSAFDVDSFS